MGFLIGLLTFILVMDCLFLMLLILIQLPKKEAGMGTAFGGVATDALFGAGAGNALTNMTKYAATIFFVLALVLSIVNAHRSQRTRSGVAEALKKEATAAANVVNTTPKMTNLLESTLPATTNLAHTAPTNPAPAAQTNAAAAPAAPKAGATSSSTPSAPATPATNSPPGAKK
jgi:preprotein translocase subunit SecG